ncbi:CD209 antigen-like protein C [Megalobrama amblycephala]|uniref:CD209 antigen-like protein C n=1 Tax=Megalobrama amblycephala TaxID=75352 RepID=UPI0020146BA7|nr:CD209 antigen-like protein C [Megalobrama amblycephala]
MELDNFYQNVGRRNIKDTFKPRTLNHRQDEERRGSRCLVLMTVCLGLICVLLLVIIIFITAERESLVKSYKNSVEEINQTINSLQENYTELTQKKLELESKVTSLSDDLTREASKRGYFFFISHELKSWSESRQYCRDRGADLVIINTEEKQRFISSFAKERVWIGLSDIENKHRMIWVDNSTLNQGFWFKYEPNNYEGNEDCIELNPTKDPVNNWNDQPCSHKRKGICEK